MDEKSEKGDEYESDSSTSEDEDDMPGLTEEEEKERQREKREKVRGLQDLFVYLYCFVIKVCLLAVKLTL